MVSVLCSVVIGLQTFKIRRRDRNVLMITVRNPGSIYQVDVPIDGGSCHGRWHFSFDRYYDPEWAGFGRFGASTTTSLRPEASCRCLRTARSRGATTWPEGESGNPI